MCPTNTDTLDIECPKNSQIIKRRNGKPVNFYMRFYSLKFWQITVCPTNINTPDMECFKNSKIRKRENGKLLYAFLFCKIGQLSVCPTNI